MPVVATVDGLTPGQIRALRVLAEGPCRVHFVSDADARTVNLAALRALERRGLAIDVAGYAGILTDAGRDRAADLPDLPEPTHEHGTNACYVLDACRCDLCREAATAYEQRRRREIAYGRPRTVDAEPVRQHVRSLTAPKRRGATNGVGLKQIAKVSGVSHGALWKLMYGAPDRPGPSKRVRTSTAEKLLAVGPQHMADGATVPARGTRDRLAALRDAGATWAEIGEQIGASQSNTHALSKRRNVTAGTARKVHDLHARWQAGAWTPRGRLPGGPLKAKLEREQHDGT